MDMWKFYDITHREHVVCNPMSGVKLGRLVELVRLPRGAGVVDIACGKGEFLIRLAEAYGVRGVGVDASPFYVVDADQRLKARHRKRRSPSPRWMALSSRAGGGRPTLLPRVSARVGSSVGTRGLWMHWSAWSSLMAG